MGIGAVSLVLGVGLVLGGGTWCTDFRLLQTAMAAKDVESARRAPLIAAAFKVFVPFIVILPGLIAVGLPTPHTTTMVHYENGAIFHEITVVPPAVEAGRGLVPAKADAATGAPVMGANGHAVLDYEMATPNMLLQSLPTGPAGAGYSGAAGLPDERSGGEPDGVQHRLHMRHLPGVLRQGRERQADSCRGPMGGGGRHPAGHRRSLRDDAIQQHCSTP